jgi:hypothetical protein
MCSHDWSSLSSSYFPNEGGWASTQTNPRAALATHKAPADFSAEALAFPIGVGNLFFRAVFVPAIFIHIAPPAFT